METISAKQLVAPMKKGIDYLARTHNMNLYQGCSHGCIYCDSRSACYQIKNFGCIRAKKDALSMLESELSHKRTGGIIGIGSMSDSYNPFEAEEKLTQGALTLIAKHGFGISLTTKSAGVARDIAHFQKIAARNAVDIGFTITTLDDDLAAKLEPNAPRPSERLDALRQMAEAGLFCGVHLQPVLPFLTDSAREVCGIVHAAADCGARYVYSGMAVTMREGNREYFYEHLDKHFPGIKANYIQAFGNSYVCMARKHEALYGAFAAACKERGLWYKMKDISQKIRDNAGQKQVSLF